jgi:hypothetical protein
MKISHSNFFTFLCLVIFLNSCSVSSKPDKQKFFPDIERKRYEDFFRRFLFLDEAVYTLYGSKPITEIILRPETPEKRMALQEAAKKKLSKAQLKELKSSSFDYEEEYWFEETWSMWEEKLKTLPIKRYLFVERKVGIPVHLQENRYIYFINIAETAKVLQKHYSLFKEYVGFDFNPLSVVFDAKNPDSSFWNAIWGREVNDKNVCLMGILFGYGFENSYPFSWHFSQSKSTEEKEFTASFLATAVPTENAETLKKFNPPESFFLPGYVSFSEHDPYKEQYKQEYSRIRKIYKDSDIIECSIRQLLK